MWIKKSEISRLSAEVKNLIAGEEVDLRDHREGPLKILRNDIHTLASYKTERVKVLQEERDILKDTLADISHQIKTPLTSLMIMSELLEDAPPEKQHEFIANIQTTLHRTEWLVSTLLKLAKLDANAVTFNRQPIPTTELIRQGVLPLKIQLELKEQELVINGAEVIECDKRWTAEALGNIIKNASDHSPKGSSILIEAGRNPICGWISVKDAGKGLERSQIARVFKRFQGDNPHGYGIGLPLALTIMKNQSGDIHVEGGSKGEGATFTLKFFK